MATTTRRVQAKPIVKDDVQHPKEFFIFGEDACGMRKAEDVQKTIFDDFDKLIDYMRDQMGWDDSEIGNIWIIHVKNGIPTPKKIVTSGFTLKDN